jgi:hypothetical protein
MNTEIVPFGKYKNQPIELMLADQNYLEWIAGQPGLMAMLQGRYPALFNVITVGAPQTDDTPEHNKLQAMFLDPAFQHAFIGAHTGQSVESISRKLTDGMNAQLAGKVGAVKTAHQIAATDEEKTKERLLVAQQETRALQQKDPHVEYLREKTAHEIKERERYAEALEEYNRKGIQNRTPEKRPFPTEEKWMERMPWMPWDSWPYKVRESVEKEKHLVERLKEEQETLSKIANTKPKVDLIQPEITIKFECGYDVEMSVGWYASVEILQTMDNDASSERTRRTWDDKWIDVERSLLFKIELKPLMGDDFPSVLRQMKRNQADTLVVGRFNAAGCTLQQARGIFGDKRIITLDEIIGAK